MPFYWLYSIRPSVFQCLLISPTGFLNLNVAWLQSQDGLRRGGATGAHCTIGTKVDTTRMYSRGFSTIPDNSMSLHETKKVKNLHKTVYFSSCNECLPDPSEFPIVNSALELTGLQNVSRTQSSGSGSVWIHPDSLDNTGHGTWNNVDTCRHHVIEDGFQHFFCCFLSL